MVKALAGSASCNLDVMCYQEWSTASNSVGHMAYSVNGNSYVCTGTLLNDQNSTGTPYFLTANHCISTQSAASTLQTFWFFHSSACNSGIPYAGIQTIPLGSTLLYNSSITDTSFLRLNSQPPAGVTFSGWSTSTPIIGTPSTGLHNPQGDLQKISFGSFAGFQSCVDSAQGFNCTPAPESTGNFLQVLYAQGITEGGSSGSGVFMNNGQYLYGQLKGGNLSCANPNGSTTYGRFDKAYLQGNLGQWLTASPQTKETLSVEIQGIGRVTSEPAGIDCPKNCITSFPKNSQVKLAQILTDAHYVFSGWEGPCEDPTARDCTVTMSSSKKIIAKFHEFLILRMPSPLSNGPGYVDLHGHFGGGMCGNDCFLVKKGVVLSLVGYPKSDFIFAGWGGDCASTVGTSVCSIKMDSDKVVSATFIPIPNGHSSVIAYLAKGKGRIVTEPNGIDCNSECSTSFPIGRTILIKAEPDIGYNNSSLYIFSGNKSYSCIEAACQLEIKQLSKYAQSIGAYFNWAGISNLNVNIQGLGDVRSNSPPSFECTGNCIRQITTGTLLTLSVSPKDNYKFIGWSGDCSGTDTCTLTMTSDKSIAATFTYSPPPPSTYTLGISKSGSGTITSAPAGINCGSTCSTTFTAGTPVTLSAVPNTNYSFAGWTGDCSGSGACVVTMNSNKNVGASFAYNPPPPASFNLVVTKTGSGTVSSQPQGINCGATCSGPFGAGTMVALVALPDNGFEFSGWSGACSGAGNCSVMMDGDKAVSANFVEVPTYLVTVTKQSGGVVSSEPTGILCGGAAKQCKAQFSSVNLTATPNAGYEFIKWVGCQNAEDNVCSLQPTKKTTVKAVFKALPKYKVTVVKNKLGAITSTPEGLKCPAKKTKCSVSFIKGTEVTLTPAPQEGRTFTGWTGACSGFDPCTLTLDGNKGVGATFQ